MQRIHQPKDHWDVSPNLSGKLGGGMADDFAAAYTTPTFGSADTQACFLAGLFDLRRGAKTSLSLSRVAVEELPQNHDEISGAYSDVRNGSSDPSLRCHSE